MAADKRERLVIIGNGMAGARTVEEIMRRGGTDKFEVVVFGEEPHGNYNRIMLSSVLAGVKEERDIVLNSIDWYRENGIDFRPGVRIASIDREAKEVVGVDGSRTGYDRLILATGSRPFVPPMEGLKLADGSNKPGVFVFRTIDDCRRIAAYATKCRKAAVLGGGLLGLESARGLLGFGVEVHIVHLMDRLMEVQLDAPAAGMLKTAMEEMAIHVHLQKATTAVLGDDRVTGLAFKDGETLECDMLVVSCGIRANVEIAKECGLTVERAIVVDDQMRSADDPSIYAVGECAQHRGRVYGLVSPLWEQARVLADHLTGANDDALYAGSKIATKLKVMGVDLASMGISEPQEEGDELVQFSEPKRGVYKKLIIRGDRLVGAMLLGDLDKAPYLMQAFDRDTVLPPHRAALLFDLGMPVGEIDAAALPDDAQICNCNGVTKGTIRACALLGNRTVADVKAATRAGTGCGTCADQVRRIVEACAETAAPAATMPLAIALKAAEAAPLVAA